MNKAVRNCTIVCAHRNRRTRLISTATDWVNMDSAIFKTVFRDGALYNHTVSSVVHKQSRRHRHLLLPLRSVDGKRDSHPHHLSTSFLSFACEAGSRIVAYLQPGLGSTLLVL